ncbi:hypothetical protein JTB14_008283 [Gonioctena quinquepunctata]|nr:hypothetical protein JTB14_008283 [Gonioctena quinquepunctata]
MGNLFLDPEDVTLTEVDQFSLSTGLDKNMVVRTRVVILEASDKLRCRRIRLLNGGLFPLLLRTAQTSVNQHLTRQELYSSPTQKAQRARYEHISYPRTVGLPRQDESYGPS